VDNCELDERRDTLRNVCATMEIQTTENTEENKEIKKTTEDTERKKF